MRKFYFFFGLFIFCAGCSGIQVAQKGPDAIKLYGVDCAKSGHEEGTEPYTDCIHQSWKMAEQKEKAREEREEMLLMIRGNNTRNAGGINNLPYRR
ncbi:MAG: hypothetical protein HN472_03780 [Nitrospina sp.]|jgi:hypothetical protein|nr:hypothetical protein [Nitrospina sp.]MBT3508648.1 hypothetical protein [Nitrospina sp.]MBT3875672.1 hypothetical protein [Nitrospina sp.]MBT4048491.1 hypothetical protein [Nitrospina sp.]MBT4558901.1 hypothetical protein [Nitrospina sp.]